MVCVCTHCMCIGCADRDQFYSKLEVEAQEKILKEGHPMFEQCKHANDYEVAAEYLW